MDQFLAPGIGGEAVPRQRPLRGLSRLPDPTNFSALFRDSAPTPLSTETATVN